MTTDANQIVDANKKVEATEHTVAEWLEEVAAYYRNLATVESTETLSRTCAFAQAAVIETIAARARVQNWTRGKGE